MLGALKIAQDGVKGGKDGKKLLLKVANMTRSIFDARIFLVRVNYSKCKNLIPRSFYATFSSIR